MRKPEDRLLYFLCAQTYTPGHPVLAPDLIQDGHRILEIAYDSTLAFLPGRSGSKVSMASSSPQYAPGDYVLLRRGARQAYSNIHLNFDWQGIHPDDGETVYAAYGHISSLLFHYTALLKADSVTRHRPCTASSYIRKPYSYKATYFPTCIIERFPARSPETCLFEGRALESVLRWRNWGLPDLGQRMPTTSKRIESKSSEEHSPFSAKTVRPSGLCVLVCGTLLPQADLQSLYLFVA